MKIKTILAAVAICIAAMSCKKEEKSFVNLDGEYKGALVMAVAGKPMPEVETSFVIKDSKDGEAVLMTPAFEAMGGKMKMSSLNVPVKVTSAAGVASIHADAFDATVNNTVYSFKKGVSGTVKDGLLSLAYEMVPGAMPMPISITFESAK